MDNFFYGFIAGFLVLIISSSVIIIQIYAKLKSIEAEMKTFFEEFSDYHQIISSQYYLNDDKIIINDRSMLNDKFIELIKKVKSNINYRCFDYIDEIDQSPIYPFELINLQAAKIINDIDELNNRELLLFSWIIKYSSYENLNKLTQLKNKFYEYHELKNYLIISSLLFVLIFVVLLLEKLRIENLEQAANYCISTILLCTVTVFT